MNYNLFSAGDTSAADATTDVESSRRHRPRSRHIFATVYDAAAGRVTYDKTLRPSSISSRSPSPSPDLNPAAAPPPARTADAPRRRRTVRLAPEDVLFRRKDAPVRYAEHDIYRAHEHDLPRAGRGVLPGSDLLGALHAYAGRFYGAMQDARRELRDPCSEDQRASASAGHSVDERSMDETALLAFGILMEEAGREVLGHSGHLVFTEPEPEEPRDGVDRGDGGGGGEGGRRAGRASGGIVPLGDDAGGHGDGRGGGSGDGHSSHDDHQAGFRRKRRRLELEGR